MLPGGVKISSLLQALLSSATMAQAPSSQIVNGIPLGDMFPEHTLLPLLKKKKHARGVVGAQVTLIRAGYPAARFRTEN